MEWSPIHTQFGQNEWTMQWICKCCARHVTVDDLPSVEPRQCPACSSAMGLVVDVVSGQVARCCTSCPQAAAPYVEQPVANVASWFVAGPLSMFGDLNGWGSGPITAPGSGTQSRFPPISMALARAEVLRSVVPFSVGGRAQVPVDQAQFWQHNVPHAIETLSNQFLAFPPSDPRAVALATRDSWGPRGDHLSSQLQEAVVQHDVTSMLTVWLTEQVSQFTGNAPQLSTTARNTDSPLHSDVVSQSPRTSPPPNPFSSVHQTTGRVSGGAVVSNPPQFSTAAMDAGSPFHPDVVSQSPRTSPPLNPFCSVRQTTGGTSGGVVVSSPFAHLSGCSFAENNSVTSQLKGLRAPLVCLASRRPLAGRPQFETSSQVWCPLPRRQQGVDVP